MSTSKDKQIKNQNDKSTIDTVKKKLFPTWGDYEAAWQKENKHDFSPELFNRLQFPDRTSSYIGARTATGKTAALVSMGVEGLFPQNKETNSRNILFISLEENQMQILRRFSLCLAYRDANENDRENLLKVTNPDTNKREPQSVYKNWKLGREIKGDGGTEFVNAIKEADEKIKKAVENKQLIYFYGIGASLAEILSAIKKMKKGDIVLLDYIQKIPADKKYNSSNPTLDRISEGSKALFKAAQDTECVIIAAAQFNREAYRRNTGNSTSYDFNDADFRGCGDIEQDGHNLIGIGRAEDKKSLYYKILKSKEGETTDERHKLIFAGGYSYMNSINTETALTENNEKKQTTWNPTKKGNSK